MAFSRTNGGNASNGGEWTTGADSFNLGFTTTIGQLLLVTISEIDQTITFTLNGAGTWASAARENSDIGVVEIFWTVVTSAVSSITITGSDNGFGATIIFSQFSGEDSADAFEDSSAAEVVANTNSNSGLATVTVNPSLLFAATMSGGGADPTKDALFTSDFDSAVFCTGYREVTSAGDYSSTATLSAAEDSISLLAVFNGLSGGIPAGSLAVTGQTIILGFTINMPDEL